MREQLERILTSQEFLGSDRARRFLRYVVEETLDGRADRIKAFSVAVAAFDRDESFDPQTDPIVRIEAGRLRRFLERYYLVAGANETIRIDIPKGAYVPTFSWLHGQGIAPADADAPKSAASPLEDHPGSVSEVPGRRVWPRVAVASSIAAAFLLALFSIWPVLLPDEAFPNSGVRSTLPQPSVAVLPFHLSGVEEPVNHLSSGMTSELVRELSRYSTIFVLGPQSLRRFGASPDITAIGQKTSVGFVLSGDIQHVGQRVRVAVQLNDTDTGGVIWAEAYERDFAVEGIFDLQAEIAQDIVRRIAQPQGAIALFDWKRTRGKAPETWDAYDCVVQADDLHRRVLPPALAPEIHACLQRAVEEESGYADAWVMLALVSIDSLRFTPRALTIRGSIDEAHEAARRAVDLAPDSGRAHLALMMTLFFRGEVEQALAAGEVAARLSPHDPDILAEVGLRNIMSGDLDAGIHLVSQATDFYYNEPLTSRLALAMAALRQGRYQDASDAAMGEGQGANFVYWSMISAMHGKAGRLEEARHAAGELLKLYPEFAEWAWVEMEARHLVPEIATAMAEGWRAAGLPVPLAPPRTNP
ncbi:MAG: tetratricopeptide repeat protein [Kiloniellaceae bacterium]